MYSEKEIEDLIAELKQELPALLAKSEEEELAKMESAKEGGNGTKPVKASMSMKKEAEKEESSSKEESAMAKEASEGESKPKPEESPVAASATDEKSSPPMPASDSAAPESPTADAPPADAAPADAAPADAGDPAAAGGDEQTLEHAYAELSDEDFQAHWEALKAVAMQRMAQPAQAAPAQPPMQPPASPSAAPPPPPAAKAPAMASAGGSAAPMMRSEPSDDLEDLKKAESKVADLEKQVSGLTDLLEKMLSKPVQKAVTSMAEVIAKSEADKPQVKPLSKTEIRSKLDQAARNPSLAKSDRDLINRYFLSGDVKVSQIEHLLK